MKHRASRFLSLVTMVALFMSISQPAFAQTEQISDSNIRTQTAVTDETFPAPLIDKSDIEIADSNFYDLSGETNASAVYALTQGTIFVEFLMTGTGTFQSLFSVSNSTTDNPDRHFHVYATPTGSLGMELRNTDSEFKYTMLESSVLNSGAINKIAFKADSNAKNYKLFANGELVSTLSKDDFKFISDITGLNKITLGGTVREGNQYPFEGTISKAQVYSAALSDDALAVMTQPESSLILERSDVTISSGSFYDLSNDPAAESVYALSEGTLFMEFQVTGTGTYQSLFSVSNSTADNPDRHFHVYVTPAGALGMELRNTDSEFKYTMLANSAFDATQTSRIAFKADAQSKTYKLFANGELVSTLSKDDFKFISDITGLDKITLGGTVREGNQYPFEGTISEAQLYCIPLSDDELISMTQISEPAGLVLEKSNISVTSGSCYDLSDDAAAETIEALHEGTVIISFTSTSEEGIQSLFSVGNSTYGNQDRHFHVYITNTGLLGMELRNTDSEFKYTFNRPASLQGKYHGEYARNTVALKADAAAGTYKLFANGELVATLTSDDYKFISDITGVDNVALGATIRAGAVRYPFGGTIHLVQVYDEPLSDDELLAATSATEYGTRIYYTGDGTNSNYYRIPTLLTLKSGHVVSSIDARYGGTHDARSNIDIAFSKSVDGGVTWSQPTLPLVFDDYEAQPIDWPRDSVGKNVQISGSAAFIDSVLLQDEQSGRLFLFADAYPYGKGFNNSESGSGFKEINGEKYIKLYKNGDPSGTYNYTIRENGVIYDDVNGVPTDYSVDGNYRIMENGTYLTQKQYHVRFEGTRLIEETTNVDVNQCVFYKDSLFHVLPTNFLAMKYSDNEGETWSDMYLLGDFRNTNQRMVLYGPGIGTQIKNGAYAGRMLISAYNSVSGDYGYLYSDDHGDTWGFVNTSLGGSGSFAEAQIIELPDGSLRTYMRTNVGKIGYITSLDGGMTWSSTVYIPDITVASYGTQLSVINYSQTVDGKPAIIMSTPTSSSGRRAGTILVGLIEDSGQTGYDKYTVDWAYRYQVDLATYGFSYSCVTELPNHDIGILYEKYDSWSRDELHLKDIMRYEIYTLEELLR